jgi:hypothetical protein
MQAKQVLHKVVTGVSEGMHGRRRTALEAMVWSAITGQELTVTGLGRSMESEAKEKHCIKRADRLLSNANLHGERCALYGGMARWLVADQVRPVILVDWSDLDETKTHQVLRASLAVAGRALTLYEEVHGRETAVKRATERGFLETLQKVLGKNCQPVIVADAGFRTPWFKAVESLGWCWISRIRHRHHVRLEADGPWEPAKKLHAQASSTPRFLGEVSLTESAPHVCRLVVYKGKPKGRHRLTRFGKRARSRHSEKNARAAREPWLLATNLPASRGLAKTVVRIYKARMQIEEAFRDLKSTRFGLGMAHHRTSQLERLAILLLIAALALLVLWLIGTAARERGYARHYQANTVRSYHVLSVVFLGLRVCQRRRDALTADDIAAAFQLISALNIQCWGEETN